MNLNKYITVQTEILQFTLFNCLFHSKVQHNFCIVIRYEEKGGGRGERGGERERRGERGEREERGEGRDRERRRAEMGAKKNKREQSANRYARLKRKGKGEGEGQVQVQDNRKR